MIERFEIKTIGWKELGYFLGHGSNQSSWQYIYDDNYQIVDRTGWLEVKDSLGNTMIGKLWFLHGVRVRPSEVFDSLTEEERAEAIWELDEWK